MSLPQNNTPDHILESLHEAAKLAAAQKGLPESEIYKFLSRCAESAVRSKSDSYWEHMAAYGEDGKTGAYAKMCFETAARLQPCETMVTMLTLDHIRESAN